MIPFNRMFNYDEIQRMCLPHWTTKIWYACAILAVVGCIWFSYNIGWINGRTVGHDIGLNWGKALIERACGQ